MYTPAKEIFQCFKKRQRSSGPILLVLKKQHRMEVIDIDLDEALEQTMGGFWFDFEQALTMKDAQDPTMSGEAGMTRLRG